jgi:hypothetical protein
VAGLRPPGLWAQQASNLRPPPLRVATGRRSRPLRESEREILKRIVAPGPTRASGHLLNALTCHEQSADSVRARVDLTRPGLCCLRIVALVSSPHASVELRPDVMAGEPSGVGAVRTSTKPVDLSISWACLSSRAVPP